MKALALLLPVAACSLAIAAEEEPLRASIQRHLGRPYVWGTQGLKSFDCSGFVWRVMADNNMLVKRTTARKFYMSLPATKDPAAGPALGTVVFFDNLKHCGIMNNARSFYHAESGKGTNLSNFSPYWRAKVCGYRAMPGR